MNGKSVPGTDWKSPHKMEEEEKVYAIEEKIYFLSFPFHIFV